MTETEAGQSGSAMSKKTTIRTDVYGMNRMFYKFSPIINVLILRALKFGRTTYNFSL